MPPERKERLLRTLSLGLCLLLLSAGCATPQGGTRAERKTDALEMRDQVLKNLFARIPAAQDQIRSAAGYAVFSSIATNVIAVTTGGGYGCAIDQHTGEVTYMKMAAVGLGIGAGVKATRTVFIFKNRASFERFINEGWDLSGQADATLKAGEDGDSIAAVRSVDPGVIIYEITERGIALEASISGVKYWPDSFD